MPPLGRMPMAYAITIFISAFLLFLVQLIMGKYILPWYGGSPAVWTTCMLFFQILLLGGYAYAHGLTQIRSRPGQARLHLVLLVGSVVLLGILALRWESPLLPPDSWKPTSETAPVSAILLTLLASVGLPFFLLSTTSPLLQRWYSYRLEESTSSHAPYRLYALSNVGSVLGLVSYPFLIEPLLSLDWQAYLWTGFYGLFVLGCIVCGLQVRKAHKSLIEEEASPPPPKATPRPAWMTVLLWLLLSASTSSMFLSVTNNLCQEVAVVPFLWVLPLLLYLLSFIICFDRPQWYHRRSMVMATAVGSIVVLITAFEGIHLKIPTHVLSYSVFLFLFCLTCHGELTRLRPVHGHLTLFYLMISLGGATGGFFVALVAPAIFHSYWEFHVTMLVGWLILALVFFRDRQSFFFKGDPWFGYLAWMLFLYVICRFTVLLTPLGEISWLARNFTLICLLVAGSATAALGWMTRRRCPAGSRYWPRILVGAVVFLAECFMISHIRNTGAGVLAVDRNFYGVVRVSQRQLETEPPEILTQLTHGQINHGIQFLRAPWRYLPVSYYSTNSGVALALRNHARRGVMEPAGQMRIGVMGLGVGTLAAFTRLGDTIRFYEINPVVVDHATGPDRFFTYLEDSPGDVELVPGDARLSLEREWQAGKTNQFDVLVMDAFSSDSIPVHLVTAEAFDIYRQHLRDEDSIIAVNISNRFLDLQDLVHGIARHLDMEAYIFIAEGDPPEKTPSLWAILTRSEVFAGQEEIQDRRLDYQVKKVVLWTDKYSNMVGLLK